MRIERIIDRHRNDFCAVMICEHCGGLQTIKTGYDDAHYHQHVIPAMTCVGCRKNRAGEIPEVANDEGRLPVFA